MAVKSVFDIKCFKDVKNLGRTISFTLRYIEIRKHFLKYHSPPPVPAKAFACICVTMFYTLYESGLLAHGGERCSAAQKPRV